MSAHICRRLVLFLDGTWNEDEDESASTNIVYLRERLFWGLATRLRSKMPEDQAEFAHSHQLRNQNRLVFDGVGQSKSEVDVS